MPDRDAARRAIVRIIARNEDANTEWGYLGILNAAGDQYLFNIAEKPGFIHCRIENGLGLEYAECIPKVALDPYVRCKFRKHNGVLVAVEFDPLMAAGQYGADAPALGVPSLPMPGRGEIYPPPAFGDPATKLLDAGVASAGNDRFIILAAEAGTDDDCIELQGLSVGDEAWLFADAGDTITLKHNAGGATDKFLFYGEADIELSGSQGLRVVKKAAGAVVNSVDDAAGASFPSYGAAQAVTIASGVLDISAAASRNIIVQAESGTADTVTEVVGLGDGESAVFRADSGDTITFQHNSDILLYNSTDLDVVSTSMLELVGRGAGVVGQPVDQNDGGTSIGTLVYSKWDVDAPPASPHASDDEFDGSVSGSAVDFDHGSVMTYAASSYGRGVLMTHAQATVAVAGLLYAAPGGDFHAVTQMAMSATPANTRIGGIILAEGTGSTSNLYLFLLALPVAASDATFQVHEYSAYNTFVSSVLAASNQVGGMALHESVFMRVRRISSTYYFDVSSTGEEGAWTPLGSHALGNLSALNYIGIGGAANNNSNGNLYTRFKFFRFSTDTGLTTPVHGQLVGMYAPP